MILFYVPISIMLQTRVLCNTCAGETFATRQDQVRSKLQTSSPKSRCKKKNIGYRQENHRAKEANKNVWEGSWFDRYGTTGQNGYEEFGTSR